MAKVIKSNIDPTWAVMSYTNGYYFFLLDDPSESAVVRMKVPIGVRSELDPIAQARIA